MSNIKSNSTENKLTESFHANAKISLPFLNILLGFDKIK